jgi:hypothetical protein
LKGSGGGNSLILKKWKRSSKGLIIPLPPEFKDLCELLKFPADDNELDEVFWIEDCKGREWPVEAILVFDDCHEAFAADGAATDVCRGGGGGGGGSLSSPIDGVERTGGREGGGGGGAAGLATGRDVWGEGAASSELPVLRNCWGLLAGGGGRIVENFCVWFGLAVAGGASGGGAFCFICGIDGGGGGTEFVVCGAELTFDGKWVVFPSCLTDNEFRGFGGGITDDVVAVLITETGGGPGFISGAGYFLFLLSLGFFGIPFANKPPRPPADGADDEVEEFPGCDNLIPVLLSFEAKGFAPATNGADRSFVTVFFNLAPFWISVNNFERSFVAFGTFNNPGGGGGAGGGGGGIFGCWILGRFESNWWWVIAEKLLEHV